MWKEDLDMVCLAESTRVNASGLQLDLSVNWSKVLRFEAGDFSSLSSRYDLSKSILNCMFVSIFYSLGFDVKITIRI